MMACGHMSANHERAEREPAKAYQCLSKKTKVENGSPSGP